MGLLRRRGERRRPGGRGDGALSYTLERLDELNYHGLLLHGPADAHRRMRKCTVGVRFARPL